MLDHLSVHFILALLLCVNCCEDYRATVVPFPFDDSLEVTFKRLASLSGYGFERCERVFEMPGEKVLRRVFPYICNVTSHLWRYAAGVTPVGIRTSASA